VEISSRQLLETFRQPAMETYRCHLLLLLLLASPQKS
jgi:hypothetical protein